MYWRLPRTRSQSGGTWELYKAEQDFKNRFPTKSSDSTSNQDDADESTAVTKDTNNTTAKNEAIENIRLLKYQVADYAAYAPFIGGLASISCVIYSFASKQYM